MNFAPFQASFLPIFAPFQGGLMVDSAPFQAANGFILRTQTTSNQPRFRANPY